MPSKLPVYDPVRKERFVHFVTLGMSPKEAVKAMGMPRQAVEAFKRDEQVKAMLEAYQLEMREIYRYDRDKAVGMLQRAYEDARLLGDPKAMVAAVRELNEMHGLHAPTQAVVTHESAPSGSRRALAELSDEELIAQGGVVIDGEVEAEDKPEQAA